MSTIYSLLFFFFFFFVNHFFFYPSCVDKAFQILVTLESTRQIGNEQSSHRLLRFGKVPAQRHNTPWLVPHRKLFCFTSPRHKRLANRQKFPVVVTMEQSVTKTCERKRVFAGADMTQVLVHTCIAQERCWLIFNFPSLVIFIPRDTRECRQTI